MKTSTFAQAGISHRVATTHQPTIGRIKDHDHHRYRIKLAALPAPGCGQGFHAGLASVVAVGRNCGISPDEIYGDLRRLANSGSRSVPDGEITAAIKFVFSHSTPWTLSPRIPRPVFNGRSTLKNIIAKGCTYTEADIWEVSPLRINWSVEEDACHLLETLYSSTDILFLGNRTCTGPSSVQSVASWLAADPVRWPFIIPNPLTGLYAPTIGDPSKLTLRGNQNVLTHRYAVVEFDALPITDQLAFWCGVNLPVAALIDSGGKSIHGWLKVEASGPSGWDADVRPLFKTRLTPLGVDGACANPARLSRLPGHFRVDKQKWQRLLFLDPHARGPRHYLTRGAS